MIDDSGRIIGSVRAKAKKETVYMKVNGSPAT